MRCAAVLWDPGQVEHRTSTDGQRPTGGIDIHWLARMRRIAPPRSRAELRVPCKKHRADLRPGPNRERLLVHRNANSPARTQCKGGSTLPVRFCRRSAVPIVVFEDDPLAGHRGPYALRRALHGARPPGLVLVREPDELGVERAHPQLAFGVRLVELAEPNRDVTADDDRTPARLDEDALVPVRVPGRWQQADSR